MSSEVKHLAHPGKTIKTLFLEPLGISIAEAARSLDIKEKTLQDLIDEKSSITPELAIRFSKGFGNSKEFWLRLQNKYDLIQLEKQHPKGWPHIEPLRTVS